MASKGKQKDVVLTRKDIIKITAKPTLASVVAIALKTDAISAGFVKPGNVQEYEYIGR